MGVPELRYENCPGVEVDVVVAAPPDAIWNLVTDIRLPARFSSEFDGADWLDGLTEPKVGARFVGRNHHPAAGEWETTSTVVECDPGRAFAWMSATRPTRPPAGASR